MIAAWMLYCIAIGLALTVVGVALERGLHLAGRPTRWAWAVAVLGTFIIPAAAWLRPEAFRTLAVQTTTLEPVSVVAPRAPDLAPVATSAAPSFSLTDLDAALAWGWGVSSVLALCVVGAAARRLGVQRRRWRSSFMDGRPVFVSENVGPAVAGVWRPEVIVPAWALALDPRQRRLMLLHEEEHVRAGDPVLLAIGTAALVLMPWNPAAWWHVRRLRLAVEMDCDARVLAAGGRAPEYSELLLQVGGRRRGLALAAALGEPRSFLEQRIRRMTVSLPRWRWFGAATAMLVAAGAMAGACEAPRPAEPQQGDVTATLMARIDSAGPILRARLDSVRPFLLARLDSVEARRMRPWVQENLERLYPDLLRKASGPPVDVWFGHDAQLRVSQAVRLNGAEGAITSARIQAVFRSFRPGNDAWSVVDRRALSGLVRDNVRVISVHLGSLNRDLSAFDEHPEMLVLPWIREGITQHYPALLQERTGPRVELWFVADAQKHVLRTVQRPGPEALGVGIDEIHSVFPVLDQSNVEGWRIAQGRGLGKLVRDNVRVIWIQLREGKAISSTVAPATRAGDGGPRLVWSPAPVYPELLRHAGIRGRVLVQAIIDEIGRADSSSVKILESPHPGFNRAARAWIVAARFEPARAQGRAVRAVVTLPIEFGGE